MTADTDSLKRTIEAYVPEPARTQALRRLKTVVRDYEALNRRVLEMSYEKEMRKP